jgi:hypothetical protein
VRSWRRITARLLWFSYGGLYFVALMGVPFIGSAAPLAMAAPLLVAAILFASIYWPVRPRFAAVILVVAILNLVVALLLVGGPGTVWSFANRHWINPPGLPAGAAFAAFILGLMIPIIVTVSAIRALTRDRAASSVPGAG